MVEKTVEPIPKPAERAEPDHDKFIPRVGIARECHPAKQTHARERGGEEEDARDRPYARLGSLVKSRRLRVSRSLVMWCRGTSHAYFLVSVTGGVGPCHMAVSAKGFVRMILHCCPLNTSMVGRVSSARPSERLTA